jgi:hypothetical protein
MRGHAALTYPTMDQSVMPAAMMSSASPMS